MQEITTFCCNDEITKQLPCTHARRRSFYQKLFYARILRRILSAVLSASSEFAASLQYSSLSLK